MELLISHLTKMSKSMMGNNRGSMGNNWGMDSMGNWGMDSMGNWGMVDWGSMGNYWGMIGWGSMDSFWVLGSTIIGDISNIAIIIIDVVVDMLDSAIRKSNRVGSFSSTSTIR